MKPEPQSRKDYIARQREVHGRKSVAVLPVHYPKELFTALGVLAVELWGPPGAPRGEQAGRLQSYVCAVVRNALAFLSAGKADVVDGILFPHTCDSVQGLATLVRDFGGFTKKAFTFQHPRGPARESARVYLDAELKALSRELEAFAGAPLDAARLARAIEVHRAVDAARAALLDGRCRLDMSDAELYALLRRGEWLWPEDHLAELEDARLRLGGGPGPSGIPVLVTGYVPEPLSTLEALNRAGAFVVADDYAAVGRRVVRPQSEGRAKDPWEALVARYWAAPPCPTRSAEQSRRLRYLVDLQERSGARGVVLHLVKFCEPEMFDVPAIREIFAARGIPLLYLEGELEVDLSAQSATRIEAFGEMLSRSGRVR